MSGSITVTGGSNSVQAGQRVLAPYTVVGSGDVSDTALFALVEGDNAIPVPANATGLVFQPPSNQQPVVWLLRSSLNASDAGLPIPYTQPTVYVFPTPGPTLVFIHASVASTLPASIWLW